MLCQPDVKKWFVTWQGAEGSYSVRVSLPKGRGAHKLATSRASTATSASIGTARKTKGTTATTAQLDMPFYRTYSVDLTC